MDAALLTSDEYWQDGLPVSFETSGSSGTPKQVVISKEALLASAHAVNQHLAVNQHSTWGLALPLHHVGGFGVAARAHEAGCKFAHFPQRWDAPEFTRWLGHLGVTHTSLVPTQVHDLVAAQQTAPPDLIAVVVGGGQLSAASGQAARDLGWPVLASYGMTEAASQIATQTFDQLQESYQPFPIPILPIWQCKTSPENILSIFGPALFSGYTIGGNYQSRDSSWHLTTDRVEIINNAIYPLGRADQLVKILGELVNPETIEKRLIEDSGDVLKNGHFVVIVIPHERRGSLLVPVVEAPIDEMLLHQILANYSQLTIGAERLTQPVLLPSFPRSELGKIRRGELLTLLQAQGKLVNLEHQSTFL